MEINPKVYQQEAFQAISTIFNYPDATYKSCVENFYTQHENTKDIKDTDLKKFFDFVSNSTVEELQELYTHTFDLNPITSLNLSYHIFKESVKRGSFLASLKEEETNSGIDCEPELPDYLPTILKLLSSNAPSDIKESIVHYIVLPSLLEIKKSLESEKNIYFYPLDMLSKILLRDHKNG